MDYFNYEVVYVMNITDIDDKIIRRARRRHLFEQYRGNTNSRETIVADLAVALEVKVLCPCNINRIFLRIIG